MKGMSQNIFIQKRALDPISLRITVLGSKDTNISVTAAIQNKRENPSTSSRGQMGRNRRTFTRI